MLTILQAVGFWIVFLVVVPALLIWLEISLGFHRLNLPFSGWVSLVICIVGFTLCASLNLWAGFAMSWFDSVKVTSNTLKTFVIGYRVQRPSRPRPELRQKACTSLVQRLQS